MSEEPTALTGSTNQCPACHAHIGWRGLQRVAAVQDKRARVQMRCPSCGTPLRVAKRQLRAAQFVVAGVAWACLMFAGARGYPATSALAWLGYVGVAAALLMQVLGPRWYARDTR